MEKTNVTRKCYKNVPLEVSCQLHILHQQCGLEIAELRKKFPGYPSYITNNRIHEQANRCYYCRKRTENKILTW